MTSFELHFSTTRVSASIHKAGCQHGHLGNIVVTPLQGDTLAQARQDAQVQDLIEREYTVKPAPCTRS